jgi:hypothetical protein
MAIGDSGALLRPKRELAGRRSKITAIRASAPCERDLEGLNSTIRLISHRSFGFHSADALIALVYLCCTGIVIDLPR